MTPEDRAALLGLAMYSLTAAAGQLDAAGLPHAAAQARRAARAAKAQRRRLYALAAQQHSEP